MEFCLCHEIPEKTGFVMGFFDLLKKDDASVLLTKLINILFLFVYFFACFSYIFHFTYFLWAWNSYFISAKFKDIWLVIKTLRWRLAVLVIVVKGPWSILQGLNEGKYFKSWKKWPKGSLKTCQRWKTFLLKIKHHYFSRNPKFVIMCHHSFSLQTWSQQYKWTTCVLQEDLYPKNSKMSFLWHCDNGKIDCISQLQ